MKKWWCTTVVPGFERLRQDNHKGQGQPGPHNKTLSQKEKRKEDKE
jgi:hypothetical protein